jgi:hypothetical protein
MLFKWDFWGQKHTYKGAEKESNKDDSQVSWMDACFLSFVFFFCLVGQAVLLLAKTTW